MRPRRRLRPAALRSRLRPCPRRRAARGSRHEQPASECARDRTAAGRRALVAELGPSAEQMVGMGWVAGAVAPFPATTEVANPTAAAAAAAAAAVVGEALAAKEELLRVGGRQ